MRESKNGTFLFERTYMDYHSDRFTDHSLMFYDDSQTLMAVLPANISDDGVLWSHQGLTYGGMVMSVRLHTDELGRLFLALKDYMRDNGIHSLYYKCIPSIYHRLPAEEDEYWLWMNNARLEVCNVSTTVNLRTPVVPMYRRKRSYCNRLRRFGYTICKDAPIDEFWQILDSNLQRSHNVRPVHTLGEMHRLMAAFPDNIKCWTILSPDDEVLGGLLLYISPTVVHTQYISASEAGKQCHALDYLITSTIDHFRSQCRHLYFDFGISNEQKGRYLNESLINQKEGFGGRGIVYKYYVLEAD